ncbi:hypothetical protein C4N9_11980 [Pararhodobacter marinus]|uniref:MOSC domain-containing protein n=2 Tax=Pararhodobacter marinus TaxID=2184063 RepID=A0A2U2CA03_9RHOB|nr:hypothetical protein C4N9_11980 [Pararhodobacter marinus]
MTFVSRAELDAALPDILSAPKDGAEIGMLCRRPVRNGRRFVDRIEVTREQGIPGERWLNEPWLRLPDGRPHPGIQICILSRRVLDLVWRDRETVLHPGDTFVVDMDLGHENLPEATLLQAGSAVLRVSEIFNDACVKWNARYGAASRDWINAPDNRRHRLRGILCSVERDGEIQNGDLLTKCR